MPDESSQPWLNSPEEVLKRLNTNLNSGLSTVEVETRLATYGRNELPPSESTPFWKLVLKQFQDVLVLVLLFAACVSFVLALLETDETQQTTAFVEPFVILGILAINASVGVMQEQSAEKAIEALKKYEASTAVVLRSNHWSEINASELVPGDIVSLALGSKIPADVRLLHLETTVFCVDQSIFTGEGDTVFKHVESVSQAGVNQAKTNMAFSGTLVTRGKALGVVCFTGEATQFGKIWKDLEIHPNSEKHRSPLKEKLDEFGEGLSKGIFFICVLVWLVNTPHFNDRELGGSWTKGAVYYFKIAVALAVAAVPEGLPAVVTTCLALGSRAMAKEGAIVRCLPAVETLGCTTVILADKTGTITTNQMMAAKIVLFPATTTGNNNSVMEVDVKGAGKGNEYSPMCSNNKMVLTCKGSPLVEKPEALFEVGKISALCNESKLDFDGKHFSFVGEPTEAALRVLVEKIGVKGEISTRVEDVEAYIAKGGGVDVNYVLHLASRCSREYEQQFPLETVLEFTRGLKRKSMSVICKPNLLCCKGAAKQVLARCDRVFGTPNRVLDSAMRDVILRQIDRLGEDAYRVLALAHKQLTPKDLTLPLVTEDHFLELECNMVFVGLVALLDPVRVQVPLAIEQCQKAGVRVVICTGDEKQTAERVARQIGLLKSGSECLGQSVSGEDWLKMSPSTKREASKRMVVMHRVEPQHKLELVQELQAQVEVVAMTGDGVNDAPALRAADIGLCMGSGTAVAREASDIILLDNNFATIVLAIRQGRSIYQNTKQFIRYLVSSNLGEVACIFLSTALGIPEALVPVQLLWVNLVTDGLPATALGFNPVDPLAMTKRPRQRSDPIVDRWSFVRFLIIGLYVGLAVVMGFVWWFTLFEDGPKVHFSTQLTRFTHCEREKWVLANGYTCQVFHRKGLAHASTVSLSILVLIEMLNAFNALSEEKSLLDVYFWTNPHLCAAVVLSVSLHLTIVSVPACQSIFGVAQLGWEEWAVVWWFSCPVLLIEEILKYFTRRLTSQQRSSLGLMDTMKLPFAVGDEKLF